MKYSFYFQTKLEKDKNIRGRLVAESYNNDESYNMGMMHGIALSCARISGYKRGYVSMYEGERLINKCSL